MILRPPALYGPRDHAFLPLFRLAQAGWTFRIGKSVEGLSLVDGRDAASATIHLLETPGVGGPYFVDDGHGYSWSEVVAALSEACGRRVRTVRLSLGILRMIARLLGSGRTEKLPLLQKDRLVDLTAPGWVCSGRKLRQETDFRPQHDLKHGFAEALTFYQRNGWLHAS